MRASLDSSEWPVGLRVAFSIIPAVMLYAVLISPDPVHWDHGGPILPELINAVIIVCLCGTTLYRLWKGVKREDFKVRKNRDLTSLFDAPEVKRK